MTSPFTIIETETGPIIYEPDYASMTMDELMEYAALGREEALMEIIKRDPRAGSVGDPNAPVTLPET